MDRTCHSRRVYALELDADPPSVYEEQQIELRATMRAPEIEIVRIRDLEKLLERVALPGCTLFRM